MEKKLTELINSLFNEIGKIEPDYEKIEEINEEIKNILNQL